MTYNNKPPVTNQQRGTWINWVKVKSIATPKVEGRVFRFCTLDKVAKVILTTFATVKQFFWCTSQCLSHPRTNLKGKKCTWWRILNTQTSKTTNMTGKYLQLKWIQENINVTFVQKYNQQKPYHTRWGISYESSSHWIHTGCLPEEICIWTGSWSSTNTGRT